MTTKNQDIILLLRDYMNFLPSGPQEAFVPIGSGFSSESDWPLTAESLRRLDKGSMTGETYDKLDKALVHLDDEEPELYNSIMIIYLREESGHRDLDHIKHAAQAGNQAARDILINHDRAISTLAHWLAGEDLYVRYPHKATGPKPGQDIKEMHDQLVTVFMRFWEKREGNLPYRQALYNAVLKMDGYYSNRHADRIIKARLQADNEVHN